MNMPNTPEYSLEPFFESLPELLCIAGFDGYFKKINPALCKLLKYTEAELYAHPINTFVHPEDQALTETHRRNLYAGKPLINYENRYLTKDGETVWLSWNSIPQQEEGLVYAIAKNITSNKEHEVARNAMLAEMTRANERLKQMNYATSHDLRSPVANLISLFSILDHSKITDPQTQEFIQMMTEAANELEQMLNRYLDQIEKSQAQDAQLEILSIHTTVEKVKKPLFYLIAGSHARITLDLKAFDTLTFKQSYLEGIFLNLITNSIKYAHPDRPPMISIETRLCDGNKQIRYTDNGIGFDSKSLKDRIFRLHEKFHNNKDGKGIGLYLIACHMRELGGHIEVSSQVNVGTTFTLHFARESD